MGPTHWLISLQVNTAKALTAKEGLLTGISGGGTMYAALETA